MRRGSQLSQRRPLVRPSVTFRPCGIGDAATSVTFRAFLVKRPARCAADSGCASLRHAMPRRRMVVTRARNGIAYLWVGRLGRSGRRLALVLGVAPQSVYRAAARGAARAAEWASILTK